MHGILSDSSRGSGSLVDPFGLRQNGAEAIYTGSPKVLDGPIRNGTLASLPNAHPMRLLSSPMDAEYRVHRRRHVTQLPPG